MKTVAELEALRQEALPHVAMRHEVHDALHVVVGMGTCGIAAGARLVMLKFLEEFSSRNMDHVTVAISGCAGMCEYEPIVEVNDPGKEKVTYVHVTPEMVPRIVEEHIIGGHPVEAWQLKTAKA